MRMLQRLNGITATRDTPRGLVVTIPDSGFENGMLRPSTADTLARMSSAVMQAGLRVSVEGYSDSAVGAGLAEQRVNAVRDSLMRQGVSQVTARNFADSRPLTSNSTAAGRMENRRVEIVVSGEAIGSRPLWDRSYDVTLR
jgi:flagellar motor protein MotB